MLNKNMFLTGLLLILLLGMGFYFYQKQKVEVFKEPEFPNPPPLSERSSEVSFPVPTLPISGESFQNVSSPTPSTLFQETTSLSESLETAKKYTLEEVQKHNNRNSCWSVINGKVYDLSSWINNHPGGSDKILSICGKDGSETFNNQHSQNQKALNKKEEFYIGDLAR